MNADDPIFRAWLDATNAFLAGAGLPPLPEPHASAIDPDSPLYRSLLRDNCERDHDPDYARQDYESCHTAISNHDMTEDQRLDDPRHTPYGRRK